MPADVAQVVCPLVLVHDMWRLIGPDSFFDLSALKILISMVVDRKSEKLSGK